MSTNFYWDLGIPPEITTPTGAKWQTVYDEDDPLIHIAKRTTRFLWAQHPYIVISACTRHKNEKIVFDEYGRKYTGAEFIALAEARKEDWETVRVGTRFA